MTNFFKNYNIIWQFYFWRVWRVLLVITNPPSLWLFDFVPQIHLSPHSSWPQKILEVSSDSSPPPPPYCSRGVMPWASHTPLFYFSHSAMSHISIYIIQSAYFYWVIKLWEFFFPVGWYKYCVLVLLCVFISSDCYYASSMLQLACQFLLASLVQIFHWSFFQFHLAWFSYTDFLCSAHSHVLHLPFTYFNTELVTMHLFTLCIFALLSVDLFYMVGNHMTIRHFN